MEYNKKELNLRRRLLMKICDRGLNFVQIYNDTGDVRICSWTRDGYVGNLLDNSFEEVYNSDAAKQLRNRLISGDYSKCNVDDCPYLTCCDIKNHLLEIDDFPQFPDSLYLAYENVCNYNCITCNIHEKMLVQNKDEVEKRYDIIEKKIEKVLPYIKHIGANGQGEIFVSKRILKLLSEWKPIAPVEECSVVIETNGSLFDEEHWKQIENLGKYHLTVMVTVMSFQEYTYQQLSGTRLPVSKIVNNLKYIKSLRDKGIVNEFHIATVVQERNFREMPEFAHRCLEEFGADYVRLRSFVPWGKRPIEEEWFFDVINPYHPYHEEYVEIMKDPIFSHPKVHDWSGGIGTALGEHPFKKRLNYAIRKMQIQQHFIFDKDKFMKQFSLAIPLNAKVVIYGLGEIGKLLVCALREKYAISSIIDNNCRYKEYEDIKVLKRTEIDDSLLDAYVIVTPLGEQEKIESELLERGFDSKKIVRIIDVFKDYS